ncbi:unnamed protein product [Symbiodinium sp. CCMP2592]|nr:unnamed protein product [Symbiodinium sp. CCMP2592]
MKSPCASVVEAYAPTASLATGLSFSPQVQVPGGVPAVTTAGLLQALVPKRGAPGPARGPVPAGVPKQQLEAMAKRLAVEAQVSLARTPANKNGRPPIRPCPAPAPASSGPSAVATASPSVSGSLSHATTPSWRSRPSQATPSAASQGTSEMACKPAMMAESIRPRLSPLLEARWTVVEEQRYRGVPQSELDRLDRIDPEVDEANAMLVESFLNVKRSLGAEALSDSRREPSRSSASRLPVPPHGSDSGLQNAGYQVLCSLSPAPPLCDPLDSAYSCSTGWQDVSPEVRVAEFGDCLPEQQRIHEAVRARCFNGLPCSAMARGCAAPELHEQTPPEEVC